MTDKRPLKPGDVIRLQAGGEWTEVTVRGPDGRIIEGATATAHADEEGVVTRITMPGGARIEGQIPMSFAFREEPEWPAEEVPWSRAVPPAGQRGETGLRSITRYHH